jgi:hypothetical protein
MWIISRESLHLGVPTQIPALIAPNPVQMVIFERIACTEPDVVSIIRSIGDTSDNFRATIASRGIKCPEEPARGSAADFERVDFVGDGPSNKFGGGTVKRFSVSRLYPIAASSLSNIGVLNE